MQQPDQAGGTGLTAGTSVPTTHLLYLHGFRSSPSSTKARLTATAVARRHPGVTWLCPALPPSPQQAMDQVLQAIRA